eukprot:COSAG02_NODE_11364_length_1739_cov_2.932317_1_plen_445_part_10
MGSDLVNKYVWVEATFESATLKSKGVRCKALQSYGEAEGALPHDLHFHKDAIIIITEQPTAAGAKWRGYLETDEKKRDGNVNPMHIDSNGVPQYKERPLDLSDSDEEDDPEIEERFRAIKKDATESAKSLTATADGTGDQLELEDLWQGVEEEDKTLTHKDKDAIIKLKEKIEQRDVELDKALNENKRLRDERNKYMSQSTSLNDRIATAHKASEEIAPWIQRDVQQALDLLRRQEETDNSETNSNISTDISVTFTEPGSLGLKFSPNKQTGQVVILGINAGTQAEAHTQLKPGLVLVRVGDTSVVDMPYKQVIETIKAGGRPLACVFSAAVSTSTAEAGSAESPTAGTSSSPKAPAPAPAAKLPDPAPAAEAASTDISVTFTEPGSLGLKFSPNKQTGQVVILGINAGTQAEAHTQLKPGLVLVRVGDTSVVDMPYKQVIETIK